MRRGLALLIGATLGLAVAGVLAEPPTADKAPWHVAKISRLSSTRAEAASAAQNSPLNYLHLQVAFTPAAGERKLHQFRVTDQRGNTVGELWGYNDKDSLLVFEGQAPWSSLVGLYLDGPGHREPLFAAVPAAIQSEPGRAAPIAIQSEPGRAAPIAIQSEPGRAAPIAGRHGPAPTPASQAGLNGRDAMGSGEGRDPGRGPGAGPGQDPGDGMKADQGLGEGPLPGMEPGPSQGQGQGQAQNQGQGQGLGQGPGQGPGPGQGQAPGLAQGAGQGQDTGPGQAPAEDPGQGPGYGSGMGPGGGGGGGGNGPGPTVIGPNFRNLAPQPQIRNHAPHLRGPNVRGPVIDVYNPEIPYYDPRWYFDPRWGYGGYGGPGYGGGQGRYAYNGPPLPQIVPPAKMPQMVLYLSCGDDAGPGTVYQVDDNGRVLGIVNLPYTATGLALHREHGLVCVIPRDGGRLMRIDDTGKVATLLEKDDSLVHPVDVGIAAKSDAVVVADNMADVLAATSAAGGKPQTYYKIEGQKWAEQDMSVAVTTDRHVLLGTNGSPGIYRFGGDASPSGKQILPGRGGVAADTATLRWAATQNPDEIHVFEGEMPVKKLKLPANKSIYRQGLLSFAPAGRLVVAARAADDPNGNVWLIQYDPDSDEIRSLFPWEKTRLVDFVVGPRMYWERHQPNTYRSIH